MTGKIFKSIFTVSLAVIVACIVIIMGFMNKYFTGQVMNELENEAEFIARSVELNGADYFNNYNINNATRVTWIDSNGTVLFDSDTDYTKMENHKNREEIVEAIEKGSGSSSRYSKTITRRTNYYALKISDGTIVRVASTYLTMGAQVLAMFSSIMVVVLISIFISAFLASKMSKKIVSPINKIDLENPDIDESYSELSPLLHRINTQNEKIRNQVFELKRKSEEFNFITENMCEGLIIADKNTEILSCNPSAIKLMGSNTPTENASVFTINRSEPFRKAVEESLNGLHSESILRINSTVCQIIANPVYFNGVFNGIVIIILDVTESEEREALRREFTSNVSHELKTPLTSIYGISDMIANGLVKSQDIHVFGENMRNEAGRLISLINDILVLSKLDENYISSASESIDLYDLSKEIISRLDTQLHDKNISTELIGEHIKINGIRTVVDEVIYNICDNAIKYNKDNGNIRVSVNSDEKYAIIKVEDSGIGIADENITRIFERFYRADKSHSKKIGGTGLGLSIAKHGVQYHKGTISAESILGKGTTMTVKLPLSK